MKIIQCWWQWSAAPFSPSGLQKARNAEKVKIENRRWSYFFSQLDPMLFGVFGPKLAKESPCGRQLVNSKIFRFCQITTPRYPRLLVHDICRGRCPWSKYFAPHENFCMLRGGKMLHIKSNLAPHACFACPIWSKISPCDKQFCSTLCVSS